MGKGEACPGALDYIQPPLFKARAPSVVIVAQDRSFPAPSNLPVPIAALPTEGIVSQPRPEHAEAQDRMPRSEEDDFSAAAAGDDDAVLDDESTLAEARNAERATAISICCVLLQVVTAVLLPARCLFCAQFE